MNTEKPNNVLPLHAATAPSKQKRGPGRPRKVEKKPTREDLEYHAEIMRRRECAINNDALVKDIEARPGGDPIMRGVQLRIAREAAGLEFDREEQSKYGRDTQTMSSRRIGALKEVADLEAKILSLKAEGMIDLHDERLQKVFSLFIETMKSVARSVLPPEQADVYVNTLATEMDGWEEKAESLLR